MRWVAFLDGHYEVSERGEVRRAKPHRGVPAGRVIKQYLDGDGYQRVGLWLYGERKTMAVHRIVADAFLPPSAYRLEVNHLDGNKTNNAWTNLERSTRDENMFHASRAGLLARGERHGNAKLTDADVDAIRARRSDGESGVSIARAFGTSPSTVCRIFRNQTRKALQ